MHFPKTKTLVTMLKETEEVRKFSREWNYLSPYQGMAKSKVNKENIKGRICEGKNCTRHWSKCWNWWIWSLTWNFKLSLLFYTLFILYKMMDDIINFFRLSSSKYLYYFSHISKQPFVQKQIYNIIHHTFTETFSLFIIIIPIKLCIYV